MGERKVIERDVYKAQQEADQTKQNAEAKAEQRRERGQQEAQVAFDKAYKIGAAEGMVAAAYRAVEAYYQRGEALREATEDCIAIGRHICQRVVGRPLKLNDVEARNISDELLHRAIERRQLSVAFAAEDWAALESEQPLLLGAFDRFPEFALGAEAGVQPELAVMRLPDGEFNAPLEGVVRVLGELFGVSASAPARAAAPAVDDSATGAEISADDNEDEPEYDYGDEADPFALPATEDEEETGLDEDEGEEPGPLLPSSGEEPSFMEEPATYHDIADLVAEIDAEDEEG